MPGDDGHLRIPAVKPDYTSPGRRAATGTCQASSTSTCAGIRVTSQPCAALAFPTPSDRIAEKIQRIALPFLLCQAHLRPRRVAATPAAAHAIEEYTSFRLSFGFGIVSFTFRVDVSPKRNKPGRSYTPASPKEVLRLVKDELNYNPNIKCKTMSSPKLDLMIACCVGIVYINKIPGSDISVASSSSRPAQWSKQGKLQAVPRVRIPSKSREHHGRDWHYIRRHLTHSPRSSSLVNDCPCKYNTVTCCSWRRLQLPRAVIADPPCPPHFLGRCTRGLLISPFWEFRKCRQGRDLLASQTSSHLLEFPIRLATTQECCGETDWRLSPPRRITRVGKDSRLDSKVLCILEPQLCVHWLLPQRVASVTTQLAVWDSLLVSLQVCYWLRGIQGISTRTSELPTNIPGHVSRLRSSSLEASRVPRVPVALARKIASDKERLCVFLTVYRHDAAPTACLAHQCGLRMTCGLPTQVPKHISSVTHH
ncbi:hypothetical protein PR048_023757 [Dryococelus australis]|uniref:Uncharacterized protein n=1 Tax=Dryococelus australis TaxID=614101 RepID=A0ABQ9GUY6_9NEOP|nr:hypothetical protein PR048_023757 [Dryococelus australis]